VSIAREIAGVPSIMLLPTSRRSRMPVSGALSTVTEAATMPGSWPSEASH
jgi:hypothetical protein